MTHPLETKSVRNEGDSYSSSDFISMARSQDLLRQKLPPVVKQLMLSTPLRLENSQAMAAQLDMYRAMSTLWNESSNVFLMGIYGKFARENGLQEEIDTEFGKTWKTKPIKDLSSDEDSKWQTYLNTTTIPRDFALEKVRSVLGYARLGDIRYIDDPIVNVLYKRLDAVQYQVALAIFPDITDEEAKKLFGQLTSAEDVRRLAIDPTEKDSLS